jgi:hydroxymethylpyrimidine pyrophosphatase-like HAD family hydrolase
MTDIKLVAIDLDGTLLDAKKQVSPRNKLALERLVKSGILVALASARDCASILVKFPFKWPRLYHIGSGGTLVYETATSTMRWAEYLAPGYVQAGYDYLSCPATSCTLKSSNIVHMRDSRVGSRGTV